MRYMSHSTVLFLIFEHALKKVTIVKRDFVHVSRYLDSIYRLPYSAKSKESYQFHHW